MQSNYDILSALKSQETADATYFSKDPSLVFARAKGSLIYDVEGKEYIDLCAGFGALALGHNPDCFRPIWQDYAGSDIPPIMHGMGDVYASVQKRTLIKKLLSVLPTHFSRVSLALSGSQAVEIAMKTAVLKTKRQGFICFEGGYHGVDLGALNLSHRSDFREPFDGILLKSRVGFAPFTNDPSKLRDGLEEQKRLLSVQGVQVAAVVLEPMQGRAGVRRFTKESLEQARRFCDEIGSLLIYDEIFCGLGRMGFYTSAADVASDLSCFGKALGGGMPLSACVGTEAAMSAWPENRGEAIHTGTFFGHPLSCLLAATTLAEIEKQRLNERSRILGAKAQQYLAEQLKHSTIVSSIRGEGLMLAIDFTQDLVGVTLMDRLRYDGVIILPSGEQARSISLTPALTIPEPIFLLSLEKICKGIQTLT